MPVTINCRCYREGQCLHQAAPRPWFGRPDCILVGNGDPRVKACALQVRDNPPPPPSAPPMAVYIHAPESQW